MRLLCDEMLQDLARWLRAAGYDTEVTRGEADRKVIARCLAENRVLITKDRHLASVAPEGVHVVLARGEEVDALARSVERDLSLDWQLAPFTRCLIDNTPLAPAGPVQAASVPPDSRLAGGPVRACPACGRVYWPGGHVRRMQARLLRWQAGLQGASG